MRRRIPPHFINLATSGIAVLALILSVTGIFLSLNSIQNQNEKQQDTFCEFTQAIGGLQATGDPTQMPTTPAGVQIRAQLNQIVSSANKATDKLGCPDQAQLQQQGVPGD